MSSLSERIANRVRKGLSRRVSPLLERVGLREPRPVPPPKAPVSPLASPPPRLAPTPPPPEDVGPTLTRAEVERVLEDMVRPALQSDGGDIALVSVDNNDVYVELQGACQTCPSSIITMQQGVERLLREEFPHFGRLVRVGA